MHILIESEEESRLAPLRTLVEELRIQPEWLYPTHVERNQRLLDEAIALARQGGTVDLDTVEGDLHRWWRHWIDAGAPIPQLTISSDCDSGSTDRHIQQLLALVTEHGEPLERVLPLVTTNVARVLKLEHKGRIRRGADADIVVLERGSLRIREVIARGRRVVADGRVLLRERNARLRECVDVMRALWRGETVTHRGRVTVQEATLYTRPAQPPLLFGAALSEGTAEDVGGWADGLLTIGRSRDQIERLIGAFRRSGGDGKPVYVQHALCCARTDAEARREAREEWRFSALGGEVLPVLRTPSQFAATSQFVTEEDVVEHVRASADPSRHVEWLREYEAIGVERVYLFNVGRDQRRYVETFGERVLPELRRHA
jgi:G6PDH family F420-dependent oxidoreductase